MNAETPFWLGINCAHLKCFVSIQEEVFIASVPVDISIKMEHVKVRTWCDFKSYVPILVDAHCILS